MSSKRNKKRPPAPRTQPEREECIPNATTTPQNRMAITESISVAAALLGFPAVLLLLSILGVILFRPVDLSHNLMALLILGFSTMGIIFLLLIGFLAGCWHRWHTGALSPGTRFGLWVNGVLLAGMLLLILLMPQLE